MARSVFYPSKTCVVTSLDDLERGYGLKFFGVVNAYYQNPFKTRTPSSCRGHVLMRSRLCDWLRGIDSSPSVWSVLMTLAGCILMTCAAVLPAQAATYCAIEKVSWTAQGENFEPAQTQTPGAAPRHVSDDWAEVHWWPRQGRAEISWRIQTHYPFPTVWTYRETLAPGSGALEGRDGFRPTPDGELPPARRMARMVELWLRVPGLLAASGGEPARLGFGEYRIGGLDIKSHDARVVAQNLERDPPWPDRVHRVVWTEWKEFGGLAFPGRLERRIDGQLIRREGLSDWSVDFSANDTCPDPIDSTRVDGAEWAGGLTQWLLRRLAMGAGSDTDMAEPVRLLNVGEGLYQILGSSHHSLVIDAGDGLVVVDAPLYPERSQAILDTLAELWPEQAVRRLVVTHHHHDHSGGIAPFLENGATLVVERGAGDYFREIVSAHGLPVRQVETVVDGQRLNGVEREVYLIEIENSHSDAMLAVHVPDAGHLFTSDLYSPGRDTHNPLWAQELQRALRWRGLIDLEISGGHGEGAEPYSALTDWVRQHGAGAEAPGGGE